MFINVCIIVYVNNRTIQDVSVIVAATNLMFYTVTVPLSLQQVINLMLQDVIINGTVNHPFQDIVVTGTGNTRIFQDVMLTVTGNDLMFQDVTVLSLVITPRFRMLFLLSLVIPILQDVIVAIRDCAFVTSGMSKNTVLSG
jgi:hypothetical protein